MSIENILVIIAIFLSIVIIKEKNNLNIIIYTSALSLISVCLYYMYKAPDLALAEIAIGSAIVPLIFIISIAKQNEFIVISYLNDDFLINDKEKGNGLGYEILEEFCRHYELKLKVYNMVEEGLYCTLKRRDADLIVEKDIKKNIYLFKGKESSILMSKLEKDTEDVEILEVIKIGGIDTDD